MSRVLFLGTPEFAVPSLVSLLEAGGLQVVGVVTQPDRRAGRGLHLTPPPIKRLASRQGIPLLQPQRIRNDAAAHEFARKLRPDLMAVVAFGQLLPASFFEIPPFGALNVHASLLPHYRGAAPVAHALLDGRTETGVSIMKIDSGMDTGPILAQQRVAVGPDTTAGELSQQLAVLGGRLLVGTVFRWIAGEIEPRVQDQEQASLAPRLKKKQAVLDWSHSASRLHNQIRAFNPWPVASSRLRGETIKVWASRSPVTGGAEEGPGRAEAEPGTIVAIGDQGIRVACGRGGLWLIELQPPNRRRLPAPDFANGWQIRTGEQFDGPAA